MLIPRAAPQLELEQAELCVAQAPSLETQAGGSAASDASEVSELADVAGPATPHEQFGARCTQLVRPATARNLPRTCALPP